MPVDMQWKETSCARDLTPANFASVQDWNIEVQTPEVLALMKSYFRAIVEVSGSAFANASTIPTVSQQIALAENCLANCYNSAVFTAGGVPVSFIHSDFAQASAVEYRQGRSGLLTDRLGSAAFSYNGDRSSRIAAVSRTTADPIAGNNALVGINLNEGKEEIYRPTNGQTPDLATLSGLDTVVGVTMAGGAAITAADVGSNLVVNGRRFMVLGVAAAVVNVGVTFAAATNNLFAATSDWYLIRRNTRLASQARNYVQILWRPSALGIFRSPQLLGPGKYKLTLNPDPDYQKRAIEYPYAAISGFGPLTAASAAYSIKIIDLKFFAATAKLRMTKAVQYIPTTEFKVQKALMMGPTSGLSWTVEGSTKNLYLFLQDVNAGTNPIIPPSVFRVSGVTANAGVAPTGTGVEQNLTAVQVSYAGTQKPQGTWAHQGFIPGQNLLSQMYYNSLLEGGRDDLLGGPETFDQWLQRGPIYCFRFERDADNLASLVQTTVTFNPGNAGLTWPTSGANLFLVAEYTRETKITRQNDQIVSVISQNI